MDNQLPYLKYFYFAYWCVYIQGVCVGLGNTLYPIYTLRWCQKGIIVFIMITKRIFCFKKILRKWVIKLTIWNRKERHNKCMALKGWTQHLFQKLLLGFPVLFFITSACGDKMLRAQLLQKWQRVKLGYKKAWKWGWVPQRGVEDADRQWCCQ